MSELETIMKVNLGANHLQPGRARHFIKDSQGRREFPPFTRLEIAQYPGSKACYLFHICEDRSGTDTWHETLDEALDQAEWEFQVHRAEWQIVQPNVTKMEKQ